MVKKNNSALISFNARDLIDNDFYRTQSILYKDVYGYNLIEDFRKVGDKILLNLRSGKEAIVSAFQDLYIDYSPKKMRVKIN